MRFEVRIPTFERPALLLRALQSLQAQTHAGWTAVVHDDSRSGAAHDVVERLADARIRYAPNAERLGAAQNIDQCFTPQPRDGGDYGCLLEDDNFWQPAFLATAASALSAGREPVLMMDQRVCDEGGGLRGATETTRGRWFPNDRIEPLELRATLMFMEGISNGGLVWRLGTGPDLRVGQTVSYTSLQEACRTLLIEKPLPFVRMAEAVWTALPRQQTARNNERNRVVSRGMQSVRRHVLRRHGRPLVEAALSLAVRLGLADELAFALGHASGLAAWRWRDLVKFVPLATLKGLALRTVEPDPCGAFLAGR